MAGYPVPGAPPIVTLVSPGAEPRRPLRYTVANTYHARAAIATHTVTAVSMEGMAMPSLQLPPLKGGYDVSVTSVSATGDISFSVAFTGISAENGVVVDPAIAEAIQTLGADYKTIHGAVVMSDRGAARSSAFDVSKLTNLQLRQTLAALTDAVENISMPLPEEPVGAGASWEVRHGVMKSGMVTFRKNLVQLVAIDGKTVTLKTAGTLTAPPQAVHDPTLLPGTDSFLQKLSGDSAGTMTLQLDALIQTSDTSAQTNAVMELRVGTVSQRITVDTMTKVAISPVK